MSGIRTDMALEAHEMAGGQVPGVMTREEEGEGFSASWVTIEEEEAARKLGRAKGEYITIDMPSVGSMLPAEREQLEAAAGRYLAELLGEDGETVLVVGLGNRDVSPDALGPKTCERVFVTRHIKAYLPETIDSKAATLCAIAPGVLGATGLETFEVVAGIVERVRPSAVIAVDALCSRSTWRIGASIQMSNAGIEPGGGVGNRRFALNRKTLGCKVIALGMPMVTYASTVASDLLEQALQDGGHTQQEEAILTRVLCETEADLIVTPKNIDELIQKGAALLGSAINLAVNPSIDKEYIRDLTE